MRVSVYKKTAAAMPIGQSSQAAVASSISTQAVASSLSVTSAKSASSASVIASATNLPDYMGFQYIGCWIDDTAARTLPFRSTNFNTNNAVISLCIDNCISQGPYNYAGVEFGSLVSFGKTFNSSHTLTAHSVTAAIPRYQQR